MKIFEYANGGCLLGGSERWFESLAFLLCLTTGLWGASVRAQGVEDWTSPIFLSLGILDESGTPAKAAFPVLVSDEWGSVHAFWPVQFHEQTGIIGDTVYYARWDGSGWSVPSDIIYTGGRIAGPRVAADPQGWLHLVWKDDYYIWYSRAPIADAGSARSWSTPIRVLNSAVSGLSVSLDSEGNLHLVYAVVEDVGGVYHTSSSNGEVWSDPVLVWSPCDYCLPELALDERGIIHVAFGSQLLAGEAVYYSRSDDGGQTWLPALEVDRVDERYYGDYGPTLATVAVTEEDEVHFIWDGVPAGQRWHQWSDDGGDTWSAPEQISAEHRGLAGRLVTAVDSQEVLHLVSMGWLETSEHPSGVFHTYWQDGTWSTLAQINDRQDLSGQHPALTIVNGNVLHIAWTRQYDDMNEIWTSSLQLDAPSVPHLPHPTIVFVSPTLAPDGRITAVPTTTGGPFETTISYDLAQSGQGDTKNSSRPVLIGFGLSLCFVAFVVIIQVSRRR